jgi:adenylate cyclase
MAFWNAPVDEAQHAELACETSLEMMEELARLQKKWTKEGVPALDIGIGLNTGDAIVGNMGSHERFDYTAMGDTINLGSRLEGLNKQYGTHIIISQHTNKHVKHKYLTRPLDFVKVKGKKEAIEIFELIAEKAKCKNKQPFVKEFEKALDYYKAQQWDAAIKGFQKALHLQKDTTAETMIERCKVFKKNPPGKDWDGSWEMKSK